MAGLTPPKTKGRARAPHWAKGLRKSLSPARIARVGELMTAGYSNWDVKVTLAREWNCTIHATQAYIRTWYEQLAEAESKITPEERISRMVQSCWETYRASRDPAATTSGAAFGPAVRVLELIAKMQGAVKIETPSQNVLVENNCVTGADADKIRTRIEELLERRKKASPCPSDPQPSKQTPQ